MATTATPYEPLAKEAAKGFANASAYDAYRPSYPPEAVDALLRQLHVAGRAHANLVEIACGTGKFTEQLAVRPENYNVVAIEPHADMRAELERKALPHVTVLDGHAAKMPVEDEWGDACIAAQSFHWFATQEALNEIHRVLKENAVFGMIWNIEDYNKPASWKATTAWEQKLNDLIYSVSTDGRPRFRDWAWQDIFQTPSNPLQVIRDTLIDRLPKFSVPLGQDTVSWTVWLSEEALWNRFNTLSQIAVLEGEKKTAAQARFREALSMPDVERNEKGEVAVHGVTYFAWTDRM